MGQGRGVSSCSWCPHAGVVWAGSAWRAEIHHRALGGAYSLLAENPSHISGAACEGREECRLASPLKSLHALIPLARKHHHPDPAPSLPGERSLSWAQPETGELTIQCLGPVEGKS